MEYEMIQMNDHHSNHCMIHMMPMYFTFGADVGAVLFDFWQVKVWWTLLLSMIVMFLGGIINQFLVWILKRKLNGSSPTHNHKYEGVDDNPKQASKFAKYSWMLMKPLIFTVQNALSYLLMLVVMTFNFWLFGAVVIGNAVGWAIFNMADGITPDCATCH